MTSLLQLLGGPGSSRNGSGGTRTGLPHKRGRLMEVWRYGISGGVNLQTLDLVANDCHHVLPCVSIAGYSVKHLPKAAALALYLAAARNEQLLSLFLPRPPLALHLQRQQQQKLLPCFVRTIKGN